jgi:hypothetical protein
VLFLFRRAFVQSFFSALCLLSFLSAPDAAAGRPTPVGAMVQPIGRDDGVLTTTLVTAYALETYATAVATGTAIAGEATTFVFMGPGQGAFSLTRFSTTLLIPLQVQVAQSSIGFVEFYQSFRNDCLFTQPAGSDSEMVVCQHIQNNGTNLFSFNKAAIPITTVTEFVRVAATQTSSDGCVCFSVFLPGTDDRIRLRRIPSRTAAS